MPIDIGPAADIHHHWLPAELIAHVEDYLPEGYSVRDREGVRDVIDPKGLRVQSLFIEEFADVRRRLELMDEAGIRTAHISPGCFPNWITMKAARLINDASADMVRNHGDRLKPMVNVPAFGEPGVLEELERGAKLGLTGVAATCHFRGKYPDEEEWLPFFQKAAELDLPVFLHAAGAPVHYQDLVKYNLAAPMGRSLDLCLAPVKLIYSGIFERIPNLRMVVGHLGGFVFLNLKRWFGPVSREGHGGCSMETAQRAMDRMLFDTAPAGWYGPLEIEYAVSILGANRIALGSDYPHGGLNTAADHLRNCSFSDDQARLVASGNARRLYKQE